MSNCWLLLDCNYLAHRSWHAMGNLSHEDRATGVIYGFLRDLAHFMRHHDTDKVALCFDGGRSKREDMLPSYKSSRRMKYKEETPVERKARSELAKQISALRLVHLPRMGFKNVLWAEGYEADDVIASVCQLSLDPGEEAVIISADRDLFQLLSDRVSMWNPTQKKTITVGWLYREFGIYAAQWPNVKAIAGCLTDDVPGVKGVGESTAAKFVCGQLNPETKKSKDIIAQTKVWQRNLKLVRLPLKGTPIFNLREDQVSFERWNKVVKSLGMESLVDEITLGNSRRKKVGR